MSYKVSKMGKLLNLLETILNIYVKNALIPETSQKIRFRTALLIDSDRYGVKTTESFRFDYLQSERILLLGEDCKSPKNLYYPSITGDFSQ